MNNFEKTFRENGIAITSARLAIFKVIEESNEHLTISKIFEKAKEIDCKIGLATVYRTLNTLCQLSLVEKSEFLDLEPVFEKIDGDNHHHHIVDINTTEIIEFDNKELDKLLEAIAKECGYKMLGHKIEIYGQKQ